MVIFASALLVLQFIQIEINTNKLSSSPKQKASFRNELGFLCFPAYILSLANPALIAVSRTIRIFSSAENLRRVARLIFLTTSFDLLIIGLHKLTYIDDYGAKTRGIQPP